MAYLAKVIYTSSDDGQLVYTFSFPFLDGSHIKAYDNGVLIGSYTVTTGQITLAVGITIGNELLIARETPTTAIVDFSDGDVLTENDLDTAYLQGLYVAVENTDSATNALTLNAAQTKWDADSKTIENLPAPSASGEAARKDETDALDTRLDSAEASITTLEGTGDGAALTEDTGKWDAESQVIKNVAAGSDTADAVPKSQLEELSVSRTVNTQDFTAQTKRIKNLAEPINQTDAATKDYADTVLIADAIDDVVFPTTTPALDDKLLLKDTSDSDLAKTSTVEEVLALAAGDVLGPAGATDNAVARYDTATGKLLQDSGVLIGDDNQVTGLESTKYNTSPTPSSAEGVVSWNSVFNTLDIDTGLGACIKVGKDTVFRIHNATGGTLTKGTVVYPDGTSTAGISNVQKAISDSHETVESLLGFIAADVLDGNDGLVMVDGVLDAFDTSGLSEGLVYLSAATAGELTSTLPTFPDYPVLLGVVDESAVSGVLTVDTSFSVDDTFTNFWNGTFRETFSFTVSSNGTVITGSLSPANGHPDMTMLFSDGFDTLTATPAATITLTAGTDTNPQTNFVYVPQSTKVLTVSTSDWPETEHIKVAYLYLRSAATTQTDDGLINQNWNDHVQSTISNQGHLSHITERIRQEFSKWKSGAEGTMTIDTGPTPDDVHVSNTAGVAYQLHNKTFPAFDTSTGDVIHVVNHNTTPFADITNLNTQTNDASGTSLNNTSFSFVLWAVVNHGGETSHLMLNLPTGSYAFTSPQDAIDDASNHSVFTIPTEFHGNSFLIARFTCTYKNDAWTLEATEDLRGRVPNASAGGGAGGTGVTTWTALTDTPSAYTSQVNKVPQVNAGETALEFTDAPTVATTNMTATTDKNFVTDAEVSEIAANTAKVTNATHTGDVDDASGVLTLKADVVENSNIAALAVDTAELALGAVTLAKMGDISADTMLGNDGLSGPPSALTVSEVQALIGFNPFLQPKLFGVLQTNGTGSPTLESNSYNLASVSRTSIGLYTFTFSGGIGLTADAYTAALSEGVSTSAQFFVAEILTRTTAVVTIEVRNASTLALADGGDWSLTIHANHA